MKISRAELADLTRTHLPDDAAAALLEYWGKEWSGAEIYISTRNVATPAFERWRHGTLETLFAAQCGERELSDLIRILGGNFIRF